MSKALERLRRWDCVDEVEFNRQLDEALAAERKATVERIRDTLLSHGYEDWAAVFRVLDAEAKR